jgi:hypothetical protein
MRWPENIPAIRSRSYRAENPSHARPDGNFNEFFDASTGYRWEDTKSRRCASRIKEVDN